MRWTRGCWRGCRPQNEKSVTLMMCRFKISCSGKKPMRDELPDRLCARLGGVPSAGSRTSGPNMCGSTSRLSISVLASCHRFLSLPKGGYHGRLACRNADIVIEQAGAAAVYCIH